MINVTDLIEAVSYAKDLVKTKGADEALRKAAREYDVPEPALAARFTKTYGKPIEDFVGVVIVERDRMAEAQEAAETWAAQFQFFGDARKYVGRPFVLNGEKHLFVADCGSKIYSVRVSDGHRRFARNCRSKIQPQVGY